MSDVSLQPVIPSASPTKQASKKPGVLIIGNFLSGSGVVPGVCEELAIRLADAGWSVTTTSSCLSKFARLLDMVTTIWRYRRQYAVAHVDVFSGSAFLWAEASCWLLRLLGKPFVITLHGGSLPEFAERYPDRVRRLLRWASMVTAPSNYLYQQMRDYADELHLLPNTLDLSAYQFQLRDRPAPRLVWLRSLHHIYNPTLAVKIVAQLKDEFPNIHLTMIGPDKGDGSKQAVVRTAAELGVVSQIELVGVVPKADVPLWMDKGDIFINTTNIDNTPVSVIEAMACGLCVVSTNVGGIPFLLKHEHDALLVPADNSEAMAEAVRRVLKDGQLAQRLSRNGRSKAQASDWTTVLPEWERLLADVVEKQSS
jgi:glycosyltransferase involved in cell wall biosynthesis